MLIDYCEFVLLDNGKNIFMKEIGIWFDERKRGFDRHLESEGRGGYGGDGTIASRKAKRAFRSRLSGVLSRRGEVHVYAVLSVSKISGWPLNAVKGPA